MSKIYTKLGDQGKTSLKGEINLDKDDLIFEVIGNIDELIASIGIVRSFLIEKNSYDQTTQDINKNLERVQSLLFLINGEIADKTKVHIDDHRLSDLDISQLEREIDNWDSKLAPLNNFLIPGDNQISSLLHFSRTVCRRTERSIVKYEKKQNLRPLLLIFFNRLSDWLFVLARVANPQNEKIWKA